MHGVHLAAIGWQARRMQHWAPEGPWLGRDGVLRYLKRGAFADDGASFAELDRQGHEWEWR